jgi:beta-lactamase superfamily II metal-dependent hydrolase
MKNRIFLLTSAIIIILAGTVLAYFLFSSARCLEVDFLDVGQGDAILIKTPAGQNILIDGGRDKTVLARLAENLSWFDRQLDLLILTHPDDDHAGGLAAVASRFKIKKFVYTALSDESPGYLALLDEIKKQGIAAVIVDRPQIINFDPSTRLEILSPTKSFAGQAPQNINNSSIVSRLVYGATAVLLTGDIEAGAEGELLVNAAPVAASAIKISHHGSDSGSSEPFLTAVNPELAVIPVGADNTFGHPSRRVLKRLERLGAVVYRTDLQGTIQLFSDGKVFSIKTAK